ncbi:MAG TPA: ABC-F family ATP-binding cassette domain-containing protein [Chloroflexia bacterium]|nr:ABC-F family ATP-binding cassette domain-containing protein [Chloroflexia bacterium]
MLQVQNLYKSYGSETVLAGAGFILNDGEHVGLIGPNGSGKTTLLRCITGREQPDRGSIVLSPRDAVIGYLSQSFDETAGLTVGEVIASAQVELAQAEAALQQSADALTGGDDHGAAMLAYNEALARYEALGGYEREHRAAAVLQGLDLGGLDPQTLATSLSGGQKTRLGLATLLLREPDILLLDEPTNHLDIEALVWLEGFVQSYRNSVLIVSHDREFLDRTVSRILYLDPESHSIRSYTGNYTDFAEAREHEAQLHKEAWTRQQEYVAQVELDIARLKGEARAIELSTTPRQPGVRKLARKKARVGKSRERKLERYMESEERVEKPKQQWWLKLDFGSTPPSGRSVLRVENVSFAYPGSPPLLEHVSLEVDYGDRIALVGPNGAGKTTLFRLIEGHLKPQSGTIRLGAGVRMGVLSQEQETLRPEWSVLETVLQERPMSETDARSFLHFFLFSGDEVFRRTSECSLGERSRLQLALLVIRGCNLLLLDEPLNHLDIEGRGHFEAALEAFEGTVIAVAHDRAFLNAYPDRIVEIKHGRARIFEGAYDDYVQQAGARASAPDNP